MPFNAWPIESPGPRCNSTGGRIRIAPRARLKRRTSAVRMNEATNPLRQVFVVYLSAGFPGRRADWPGGEYNEIWGLGAFSK
jgi:hypothetical protein